MIIQGFDDKTICSDCLASEKFLASSYNQAVTECSNDQLKRDFMAVYQDEQNCLKSVWDVMNNRGWYNLSMASQQEIMQIQQQMQQEQAQLQQGRGMAGQFGVGYQAQQGMGGYAQTAFRAQQEHGMGNYQRGGY